MDDFTYDYNAPGSPPGELTDERKGPRRVTLTVYDADGVTRTESPTALDCSDACSVGKVVWLDVMGVPDAALLRLAGEAFGLHPLALEDVQRAGGQRPKAEVYGETLFVVLNDVEAQADGRLAVEQVSLFLGKSFVVSFRDDEGEDPFAAVRRRLEAPASRMRQRGVDYLFYALIDVVIDRKFPFVEHFGERLEAVEAEVLTRATRNTVRHIQTVRRALHLLRRAVWPERDVINTLMRDDFGLIQPETRIYLRDCYDHAVQIIEVLETYRETASALMDVYVSSISNRLNEIMRVLTVIATIFMPLSFLASVFGMNFDREASPWNMPELGWAYGYPAAWTLFIVIGIAMVVWFRRRGFF